AGAMVVFLPVAWWNSVSHNRDYLAQVSTQFEELKKQVATVRAGARNDLGILLPALNSVSAVAATPATADGTVPWSWRFGLYQGGKLEAASQAAYRRMLEDTFLPSLASYLETYLRNDAAGSPEEAYDALKTYVMLYDPSHFNRDATWSWYQARGDQLVTRADADVQRSLKTHFDALYERGWVDPVIAQNAPLATALGTHVWR